MATMSRPPVKDVNEYLGLFPADTQKKLKQLRALIKKIAPGAKESISYAIPTYKVNGSPLVYFAGYEHHIGLYPMPVNIKEFKKELSKYKQGKGSVQLPLEEPLPTALITKMVKFRQREIAEKEKAKKKK